MTKKTDPSKYSFRATQFREFVWTHSDFLVLISQKINGKNYWNCICSAMDWLDVATENLDSIKINKSDWKEMSMQIYMYISCIDIVFECIKALHKFFINSKTIPFENENSIFNDCRLYKDDNEYFKHIRAAFGAHPVEIREGKNKNKIERYASWPVSKGRSEFDFYVLLYSEKQNDASIPFGFKMKQLELFFDTRYKYLEKIEKAIREKKIDFFNEMKSIPIMKVNDPIEQLAILKRENDMRLNNQSYDETIDWLTCFFSTEFIEEKNYKYVKLLKDEMLNGVNELLDNIQNLVVPEFLKIDSILNPEYSHIEGFSGYVFAQITANVQGTDKPIFGLTSEVADVLSEYIVFEYQSIEELYWLVIIALHIYNNYYSNNDNDDI